MNKSGVFEKVAIINHISFAQGKSKNSIEYRKLVIKDELLCIKK